MSYYNICVRHLYIWIVNTIYFVECHNNWLKQEISKSVTKIQNFKNCAKKYNTKTINEKPKQGKKISHIYMFIQLKRN